MIGRGKYFCHRAFLSLKLFVWGIADGLFNMTREFSCQQSIILVPPRFKHSPRIFEYWFSAFVHFDEFKSDKKFKKEPRPKS